MCLKTLGEIKDFQTTLINFIIKKSKEFDKIKAQSIEKIKQKVQQVNYKNKIGSDYVFENGIINCRNKKALENEQKKHIDYLENLADN
jgi:hypothetical protein